MALTDHFDAQRSSRAAPSSYWTQGRANPKSRHLRLLLQHKYASLAGEAEYKSASLAGEAEYMWLALCVKKAHVGLIDRRNHSY